MGIISWLFSGEGSEAQAGYAAGCFLAPRLTTQHWQARAGERALFAIMSGRLRTDLPRLRYRDEPRRERQDRADRRITHAGSGAQSRSMIELAVSGQSLYR
jgi:hypothetical protein